VVPEIEKGKKKEGTTIKHSDTILQFPIHHPHPNPAPLKNAINSNYLIKENKIKKLHN
jgi:hypothetical protein